MTRQVLLSYRTLGLGDLLTAVPALRGLRGAFPDHRHVLATPGWLAPLVPLIGAVDDHVWVDELEPVAPQVRAPEVAVVLHGSGPQSHRRVLETRPGRLIAYHHPAVHPGPDAPRWDPDEHEVARWCRLLDRHGIACDAGDLDIRPPPAAEADVPAVDGATLVHPGAKSAARRWPPDRFAAIARSEHRRGRAVVITGSRADVALATQVARWAGLDPTSVLAGRLDLAALTHVVARAGRVLCGDTGVAHLATAVGTPSVVLFGPSSPQRWGPPADRRDRHRVLWAGREGDPLADRRDDGLLELTVTQVRRELALLDHLTASTAERASPAAG